jgi:hypothetical protein
MTDRLRRFSERRKGRGASGLSVKGAQPLLGGPFKNREGKARKNRKADAYRHYARGCGFCSNAASAAFSTVC